MLKNQKQFSEILKKIIKKQFKKNQKQFLKMLKNKNNFQKC